MRHVRKPKRRIFSHVWHRDRRPSPNRPACAGTLIGGDRIHPPERVVRFGIDVAERAQMQEMPVMKEHTRVSAAA